MKFTRKSDYALRAMQHLARARLFSRIGGEGPVSVQTIAERSRLSQRFLQAVVSQLVKAGLVHAVPGPRGGISLAREPESISVLDIIEAVEGRINLMDCLEHPSHCHDLADCSIFSTLHNAQSALIRQLRSTTLRLMVSVKGECSPHRSGGTSNVADIAPPPSGQARDCPVIR